MDWLSNHFFRSIKARHWGKAILLGTLLGIAFILYGLVSDRMQAWANAKIDAEGAHFMTAFFASVWFPLLGLVFLTLIWAGIGYWLWPGPKIIYLPKGQQREVDRVAIPNFDPGTIRISITSIDFAPLSDAEPSFVVNLNIVTPQWEGRLNTIQGSMFAQGKELQMPCQSQTLPRQFSVGGNQIIPIKQPIATTERAAEIRDGLSVPGTVLFSWHTVQLHGIAYVMGTEQPFTLILNKGQGVYVRGPVPFGTANSGGHGSVVMMAEQALVSQFYFDNHGNSKKQS